MQKIKNLHTENIIMDRRYLEEATKEDKKIDERYNRKIGLPGKEYYRGITGIDPEIEEIVGKVKKDNKDSKKSSDPETSTTMKTINTKLARDPLNNALTGLGTNQKKESKKKKNAETDRVPGNLVLPGHLTEATLLLELSNLSRASGGNPASTKNTGPLNSGSGGKVTVPGELDDIADKIERRNRALAQARAKAGDVKPSPNPKSTTIYTQENTKTKKNATENNRMAQERLAAEAARKEAEAQAKQGQ
jgi:hypothetical protein